MVIPPLIGNPYNEYINPYCKLVFHPLPYRKTMENNGIWTPQLCCDLPRKAQPANQVVLNTYMLKDFNEFVVGTYLSTYIFS